MQGLAVVPPQLLSSSPDATAADLSKRHDIKKTAQQFEASFLAIMLQQMFTDTEVGAPFGGGQGETMFKSFMTEAMGKQMAKSGGVGLAASVEREMLKLQGLTEGG